MVASNHTRTAVQAEEEALMKIESVRIQNLRSFSDETVPFNDYTCLVGPNGSGKSTVLCALNIFFRETDNASTDLCQLEREDFHHQNTDEPVSITVTFCDLNKEAQEDFADYFRQDRLVVSAVAGFDETTGKAEVRQYGQRLGMPQFKPFFRALGDDARVAELKEIYAELRTACPDLPRPGTKDAMIEALRGHEAAHPDDLELIPSGDQFYGFSKGSNRLAKHIQWVFVPAVKDATTEQIEARNSALGKLMARTVRSKTNFDETVSALRAGMRDQYQALLDENQQVLDDLSASLQTRLSEWAHPNATLRLQWRQDPDKSVRVEEPWAHILAGEGDFEGALARFGHGLQRSYLLALLQELASLDAAASPTLVLGCEEPELYQHPPQARHLAAVLQELSKGNSQIIFSTHSPLFVSGEGFEDVRLIRKDDTGRYSTATYMSYIDISKAVTAATGEQPKKLEGVMAKIHQTLQPNISEMFFTQRLVLVEGLEDLAFITTCLNLMGRWDEYRRAGCHIVPVNGKSELLQPLVIARHMGIPTYVVFDADADKPDRNNSRAKHEKDNKALLALMDAAEEDPMPQDTIWGNGFTIWHSDIASVVGTDIGKDDWIKYRSQADHLYGHTGGLGKNSLHIGTSLAFAWDDGKQSTNLLRLCNAILAL